LNDLAKMTEEGTHRVLALTEAIETNRGAMHRALEQLKTKLGSEHSSDVEHLVEMLKADEPRLMNIHVALSFQDLVAQRVAKLVTILNDVQHKLLKLVVIFGIKQKKDGTGTKDGGRGDDMLRQLEASKTTALEQDLVDDILSEFGCA
jgi:chemotaxis protein CheZ